MMNDFKIGDEVKIDLVGDRVHGKSGIIFGICTGNEHFIVKIPDFVGHDGEIKNETEFKWYVHFSNLIKLAE